MVTRENKQYILHFAVSMLGGFFGGYAIYNHCDVFGNAQTANLIHLVNKLCTGDFAGVWFLVAALFVYMAGNAFFVVADRYIRLNVKTLSLIVSGIAILIIGIFPDIANDYLAILPILFVTPVLWNSFRTAGSYVTSPIFSTNNLRVATISTCTGLLDKDRQVLKKAKFYWLTIASFHVGVAIACVASVFSGTSGVWFGFIPLALSAAAYAWMRGAFDRSCKQAFSAKGVNANAKN